MEEIKKVLLLVLGCAVQVRLGRWVERAALVFALRDDAPASVMWGGSYFQPSGTEGQRVPVRDVTASWVATIFSPGHLGQEVRWGSPGPGVLSKLSPV